MANTKKISLTKLKLDLENPRIPTYATEEAAIKFLCDTEKVLGLAKDIAQNGISPCEKLIALQDKENYIVIEGNRRLVALRLLDKPDLAPEHLLKTFKKYSASRKVQISSVECVIFSSRKEAKHWIETKHSGQDNGKGVKPWNAIQKARYFQLNKNRFAYLLFNHLLEDVSQSYNISTVTRFISGSIFFEYTGIRYHSSEDELTFSCSYKENSALDNFLKQFVRDITEGKLNSRNYNRKESIKKYFEILSQGCGLNKSFTYSKNNSIEDKVKKEREYSKGQYSLFPNDTHKDENYQKQKSVCQVYDKEIQAQLEKLNLIKPISIYSSVKKLLTNNDTPLIYIAFSCLFEGLTGCLGRKKGPFDKFLENNLSQGLKLLKTESDGKKYINENERAILALLTKIREQANTAKHSLSSVPLTYQEVANDVKILKPILIQLINEVYERKLEEIL